MFHILISNRMHGYPPFNAHINFIVSGPPPKIRHTSQQAIQAGDNQDQEPELGRLLLLASTSLLIHLKQGVIIPYGRKFSRDPSFTEGPSLKISRSNFRRWTFQSFSTHNTH